MGGGACGGSASEGRDKEKKREGSVGVWFCFLFFLGCWGVCLCGVCGCSVLCVCVCLPADIHVMSPFKKSIMCDPKLNFFHISLRAFVLWGYSVRVKVVVVVL